MFIEAIQTLQNKWIDFIHSLFASKVLEENRRLSENYQEILNAYIDVVDNVATQKTLIADLKKELQACQERHFTANRDGAIAVQVIKERLKEEYPMAYAAQQHGLKQRNQELILANERLRGLLAKVGQTK